MKKVREGYKMTELGEIPSDWEFKSLKDICYIKGRIGWQGLRKDEFISEGPYLITGINFDRGKIIWNECYHITNERYEQAPEIQLKVGDVLMTKDGTIGKLLYVDNLPDKASLNSHLFVMRPINDSFISKYFYYHLQSKKFKKYIDNNKTGSTMPAITQAAMEKYKLILPPLEEQERIASILSIVDERIDNVDALIEKNKELKKGLMQTLLTKGIGHTKFKKSDIGEIPEEWEVVKFFDFVDKIIDFRGRTPKKLGMDWGNGNIQALSANNVKMGEIDFSLECYLASEELYKKWMSGNELAIGDILMTMEAPLGNIALVPDERKYILSQRVIALKTREFINNKFMKYMLMSDVVQNQLDKLSTGTTAKGINQKNLARVYVKIPVIQEQEKIASILSEVDKKIEEYENKKQKLEELKKGLMQQLLTGMIRVTV